MKYSTAMVQLCARRLCCGLLMVGLVAPGQAAVLSLDAIDSGFVTELGGSAKGDGTLVAPATYNYSVGREVHYADGSLSPPPFVPMDRNNYFVFDLTAVSSTILSASLEIFTGTYESLDSSEVFELVAPADPGAAISDAMALAGGNAIGSSEFDDPTDPLIGVAATLYGNIASGPPAPLASTVIDATIDDSILSIPLLDVAYLNAHLGGLLIIGGTVPTALPADGSPQQPFGFTGPDISGALGAGTPIPTLTITIVDPPPPGVPVPATLMLILAGIGGLVCCRSSTTMVKPLT